MFDYTDDEWSTFSKTEKKIIILARQYNVDNPERMRLLLNWPLTEPVNKVTYNSQWSRLMGKMRKINHDRINSEHE